MIRSRIRELFKFRKKDNAPSGDTYHTNLRVKKAFSGGGGSEKKIADHSAQNAGVKLTSNEHSVVTRLQKNVRPDALKVIAGKRLHPDAYKRLCSLGAGHLGSLSGGALAKVSELDANTIKHLNALDSKVLNILAEELPGNTLSGMHKLTDSQLEHLNAAALHKKPAELVEMAKQMTYPG